MPDPIASRSRTPDELTAGRREALDLLRAHLVADHLDLEGHERWASAILAAATAHELDAITRALRPAPPSVPPPAKPRRRRRRGALAAALAAGVVVVVAVRAASDAGSPPATVPAGSEESTGSGLHAPRRQHLADVIAREGTLDPCPDADALIEQVADER